MRNGKRPQGNTIVPTARKSKRGGYWLTADTPPADFYLCRSLLKSLAADAVCTDLKLLREQLQDRELIVQPA